MYIIEHQITVFKVIFCIIFAVAATNMSFVIEENAVKTDNVTVNESESVHFVCSLESNPKSEMSIKKGNQIMKEKNATHIAYDISSTCDDADIYICSGKNQFNTDWLQRNISFFVLCKPCKHFFSCIYNIHTNR